MECKLKSQLLSTVVRWKVKLFMTSVGLIQITSIPRKEQTAIDIPNEEEGKLDGGA